MLAKLVLDVQAEQKAMRAEMQHGFAALAQKVDAQSTTLVSMRRELRSLQSDMAVALSALDDHSRRLGMIEKADDDQPHA
ncbi:MAG: hypothetical protein ACREET_16915 [Stellaceae bacterium]